MHRAGIARVGTSVCIARLEQDVRSGRRRVPAWHGIALCLALLLSAGPVAASELAALADTAAKQCEAGDVSAAAASLEKLLAGAESELGPASETAQVVRLNLAHLERARGNAARAAELEQLPKKSSGKKPDRKLKNAVRGLRICAALESSAPPPTGPTLSDRINLARNQLNRGKFHQALQSAQDALANAGKSASAKDMMRVHETLALANHQLGRRRQALDSAEAADRYAAQLGENDVRVTVARLTLALGDLAGVARRLDAIEAAGGSATTRAELAEARGDLWLRLGSPRRAAGYLDRALKAHRKLYGAKHPSTAAVLHLRGDALRSAGDFPAAMAAYREAHTLRSQNSNHADTARTLNAIGVLQADLGDWRLADKSFSEAQTLFARSGLGDAHPDVLTAQTNRALARWGAVKNDSAATAYADVVNTLRVTFGAQHPSVAAAVRNLAKMEFELGHAARAEAHLEEALAAQVETLGAEHPALAPTRLARARLQAHRGALKAAAREVDASIAVLSEARGPDHSVVVRARTLRSNIAAAQGDTKAAFDQARAASEALARYTRHTFGAISDRQRALLGEDAENVVGALLSAENAPAKALFLALLPHRDAVLRSIAAGRAQGSGAGNELSALRARYVATVLGEGPDAARDAERLAAKIDALEARAAGGRRTPESDPEDVLRRACARLPQDAALVKFSAYDRTPRGRFGADEAGQTALVVRGANCAVTRIALPDADAIEVAAEKFAGAMRKEAGDDRASREALSRALLAPLMPALKGITRWLVIPDGSLWGVPIGALPDPENPKKYLFERVTVGYLTSTFELAESVPGKKISKGSLRPLLVGAPDFGAGSGPIVLTDTGPCQMLPFDALPGAEREIADIESVVHAPAKLVGAAVTKPGIEKALRQDPWLVHFATHAYFAGGAGCGSSEENQSNLRETAVAPNPLLLSGIVLAGANQPARVGGSSQSGILTAYEVSGLDLQAAGLVVLSACDTGTGLHLRGQEVQGLRWGFRAAGASALVTSLWKSNDDATRRLMRAFYEALTSDELSDDVFRGPAALRKAQLAQVKAERMIGMQRPATWANFIFSGVL